MQRIEGRGLLCHCPKELKIQDAPNESTDAAGGEKDHDKSRFFFGAQYSTYATKKKLKGKRIKIIPYSKTRKPPFF